MQEIDEYFPESFYMGVQVKYCLLEVRNVPTILKKETLHKILKRHGPIEFLEKHPEKPDVYNLRFHRTKRPLDFNLFVPNGNLYKVIDDDHEYQIVPAKGQANTIFVCNFGYKNPNFILDIFRKYGTIMDYKVLEEPKKMIKIVYEEAIQALKALYNEHYCRIFEISQVPMKVFYMEYDDYEEPNLFVANIPEDLTEMKIYKIFRDYGIIVNIVKTCDQAYITFFKKEAALNAEEMMEDCKIGEQTLVLFTLCE